MRLHLPVGPEHAPKQGLFNEAERKRFISMSVVLAMVVGMMVYGWFQAVGERKAKSEFDAGLAEAPEAVIITPRIDLAELESLTGDATPEQRVLIESGALEELFTPARMLSADHFEPMNGRDLTAELAARIVASPGEYRGQLFRAYGVIEAIDAFDGGGTAHYRGRLRLEDGGTAWFALLKLPTDWGKVGQFVRVDGLLLKVYRGQTEAGRWVDAPLLVSRQAERAYPRMEPVTALDPMVFADVQDDSAEGITGQPFFPFWTLVSYAQNVPEGAIDWDAAPVLDKEIMEAIFEDGSEWRAKPVRIPGSEVLAIWHLAQPENPVRIPRMIEGWAGNWDWGRVIKFSAPVGTTELKRNDYMTARGFFLKNLSYEPRDGGVAVVPYFVLHSFESHTPVRQENPMSVVFGLVAIGVLVLVGLVYVSLMRDRRKANELQAELIRRRRARRAQRDQGPQPQEV